MRCPKCENINFVPTEDVKYPLKNFGKQKYDKFNYRYIFCLQCGYRFVTKEVFEREVNVVSPQGELFNNEK